jgi:hypothetical protein
MNPLTPYLAYLKWGAAAALLAGTAGAGFHFGGLSADDKLNAYKTTEEAQHVAQLQAVVSTMENNARDAAADHAKLQKVIDAYDATKDIPDPASIGTAHRVLLLAASAGAASDCPVQQTGPMAGGSASASGGAGETAKAQSRLVTLVEADLDDYIAACGRDDKRLVLAQGLAPK